jgi:hypothetical protein
MASLLAALQCQAQTPTLVVSNKWSLNQNSRWDLDAGNLARGVAINKLTGNVLLCSRVTSNHVLGPYSTNAAAASPYTTNTAAAARFFRLAC